MSKECLDSHRACIVVSFWITVTLKSNFEFTKNHFMSLCVRVNDERHCTADKQLQCSAIYFKHVLTARTTFPNTQLKSCNFLFNCFTSTRISIHDLDGYMVYKEPAIRARYILKVEFLLIIIPNWFYLLIHTEKRYVWFSF